MMHAAFQIGADLFGLVKSEAVELNLAKLVIIAVRFIR